MKLLHNIFDFFYEYASSAIAIFLNHSITFKSSHMDTIPHELLIRIFRIIVNDSVGHPSSNFILAHVCCQWRRIVLSEGSLWARIALFLPVHQQDFPHIVKCLERSSGYPLDILLDFRDPGWNWNEDSHAFRWQDMEPIMQIFLVHVARWSRFELLADTWAPIFTFLWYTRYVQSAPMLTNISLSRCNLYYAARGQTFQPVALRQPLRLFSGGILTSLKSVSLIGVHIDWQQSSLRDLTQLELKYHARDVMPTLSQFEGILQACPGLLCLAIFGWGPIINTSGSNQAGQLYLQHLQKLSFGFLDIPYSIQLLSLFNFPSLVELILEDISRVVSPANLQDATSLVQWLSSSTPSSTFGSLCQFQIPNLVNFELHNIRSSPAGLASLLQKMQSLKRLGTIDIDHHLLSILCHLEESGTLCPQLQELYCQDMDPDTVLSVVSSRAHASTVAALTQVTVDFIRTTSPSVDSPMYERMINAGIIVQGRYGSDYSDSISINS